MRPEELLDILTVAGRLKTNTRHCYTLENRKESVADHSWRIALMAMLLSGEDEFQNVDLNKVIRMCLIHDLGEAFTGDVPAFEKKTSDEKTEEALFNAWVATFQEPQREEWRKLLQEMKAMETGEAKTYKALDKLEAVISHNESDIATWLPLEYELQLTYGENEVQFSAYFKRLKEYVNECTKGKIASEGSKQ